MNKTTAATTGDGQMMRLLTYKDVAELIGVSVRQVATYTSEGILPCLKIGRLVRFQPEDVREFLLRHRLEARRRTVRGIPEEYLPPFMRAEGDFHG